MDLKSLKRCDEVKKSFLDAVAREFTKTEQLNSDSQSERINCNIIKCLNSAAKSCQKAGHKFHKRRFSCNKISRISYNS